MLPILSPVVFSSQAPDKKIKESKLGLVTRHDQKFITIKGIDKQQYKLDSQDVSPINFTHQKYIGFVLQTVDAEKRTLFMAGTQLSDSPENCNIFNAEKTALAAAHKTKHTELSFVAVPTNEAVRRFYIAKRNKELSQLLDLISEINRQKAIKPEKPGELTFKELLDIELNFTLFLTRFNPAIKVG